MQKIEMTNQDAIEKWKSGRPIWTAELGGIGPGYEQAIQDLLWSIFSRWNGSDFKDYKGEKYPEEYTKFADEVTAELDKERGFSGAQVGAAKGTAFQFIRYGYAHMMNKLEEDRHILVTKSKDLQ